MAKVKIVHLICTCKESLHNAQVFTTIQNVPQYNMPSLRNGNSCEWNSSIDFLFRIFCWFPKLTDVHLTKLKKQQKREREKKSVQCTVGALRDSSDLFLFPYRLKSLISVGSR